MSGILLPSQVPPQWTCACGKQFYSKPAGVRHTAKCSEASDLADQAVAAQGKDAFSGYLDREAREWIDKRLAEGKPATKNGRPA